VGSHTCSQLERRRDRTAERSSASVRHLEVAQPIRKAKSREIGSRLEEILEGSVCRDRRKRPPKGVRRRMRKKGNGSSRRATPSTDRHQAAVVRIVQLAGWPAAHAAGAEPVLQMVVRDRTAWLCRATSGSRCARNSQTSFAAGDQHSAWATIRLPRAPNDIDPIQLIQTIKTLRDDTGSKVADDHGEWRCTRHCGPRSLTRWKFT